MQKWSKVFYNTLLHFLQNHNCHNVHTNRSYAHFNFQATLIF